MHTCNSPEFLRGLPPPPLPLHPCVQEYLFLLKLCAETATAALRAKGAQPADLLVYLAAAVSDFYIPRDEMSEHKIQSRDTNRCELSLAQVWPPWTTGLGHLYPVWGLATRWGGWLPPGLSLVGDAQHPNRSRVGQHRFL